MSVLAGGDIPGGPDCACRYDALSRYFVFRSLPRWETVTKFTSNILPMRSLWIAIVARKTFSYGCSATPSGWSITRALRLTTGLIFIRFGIRLRRVRTLHNYDSRGFFHRSNNVANHCESQWFTMFRLTKQKSGRLIPHSGLMCLLDSVTQWDDGSIICITNTHRDPANPLRRDGRLSVSTLSNTPRKPRQSTVDCVPARSAQRRHPAIWLPCATPGCMWYFWMTLGRRCRSVQTASLVMVPTQFMSAAFSPTMLC